MRILILFTLFCAAVFASSAHGTRESLLVSTVWLADHLHDSNLIVLALGDAKEFAGQRGDRAGARSIVVGN